MPPPDWKRPALGRWRMTILVGGHDLRRDDWAATTPEAIPHSGRFARNAASLFAAPDTVQ